MPRRLDTRQSTSRTGSRLDGAAAESSFATLKTEIGTTHRPNRPTARHDIEARILEYNQRRLQSSLDHQTPAAVTNAWQQHMATAA